MTICLFVYGSLQQGGRSHDLLASQEYVGPARTRPWYRLYDRGPYPCLVEEREHGVGVRGEVWRVDAETLDRLDEYEGVPDLYARKEIALEGFPGPVLAYFYNGDVSGYADCGDQWPAAGS